MIVTREGYRVQNWKYFYANGYATAVVAVAGEANDWAAYIGGADYLLPELEAVAWVARTGCKLPADQASAFFPEIAELNWNYRR